MTTEFKFNNKVSFEVMIRAKGAGITKFENVGEEREIQISDDYMRETTFEQLPNLLKNEFESYFDIYGDIKKLEIDLFINGVRIAEKNYYKREE